MCLYRRRIRQSGNKVIKLRNNYRIGVKLEYIIVGTIPSGGLTRFVKRNVAAKRKFPRVSRGFLLSLLSEGALEFKKNCRDINLPRMRREDDSYVFVKRAWYLGRV